MSIGHHVMVRRVPRHDLSLERNGGRLGGQKGDLGVHINHCLLVKKLGWDHIILMHLVIYQS